MLKKIYYKHNEGGTQHQNIISYLKQQKIDNKITSFLVLKKLDKIPFDLCRYLISNYL